ncbi:hypothetical protein [Methylobacterium platani]|uniref:Glutamine amidotransferase n=1 Tax=Methylobacterium platani TaxID=427683 RepID=A0A179SCS9_9HYPH|nr:hypothetical protein [Methylobacterium platani]OAS25269.1 hypothetical protein A5481_10160 [Methylobacterium platani]
MFTLEIDGTAVAIIRSNEERARELLEVEGFKDDLRTMKSDGRPLWTGKPESLKLRPATEDEVETFEDSMDEEDFEDEDEPQAANDSQGQGETDDEDEEDDVDILFLVDIDDEDEA